ncbi:hypothetical protein AURANDRAFT_68470, partial [Aureococcus anophagefferens]
MADAAPSRASTQTAPRLRRDQASKHAHVRHRANLEVGLGRMLAVAEMQLRATAATNDDLGDALAEDRRRLLDAALCALAEARALGEPSEAAKRRRRGAAPPWFQGDVLRLALSFAARDGAALGAIAAVSKAAAAASAGAWADLVRREAPSVHAVLGSAPARRLRRVYFKNLRYGPATPPRPRRVHGCVEFIVDGVVRASSVAAFGDAGSRGCSVHVFAPPVPFKTKADRVGGNVTYDGFHQPVVIQDFEVRALAVADRYACSWTGHSDERREWQQIHAVDDRDEPRDEPYFDSMLAVLETRVPVDKDCSVCAIYRSLFGRALATVALEANMSDDDGESTRPDGESTPSSPRPARARQPSTLLRGFFRDVDLRRVDWQQRQFEAKAAGGRKRPRPGGGRGRKSKQEHRAPPAETPPATELPAALFAARPERPPTGKQKKPAHGRVVERGAGALRARAARCARVLPELGEWLFGDEAQASARARDFDELARLLGEAE